MRKQIKVLLLDGHTVQVLAMAKALYKKGYFVTVFCEQKLSFGWTTRYTHKKVLSPSAINSPNEYMDFLEEYLKKNTHDVAIPLFNDTAELTSKFKYRFKKYINIAIPDYETLLYGHDKNLTMGVSKKLNIPHPKTYDLECNTLEEAAKYCGFPSLIKPNIGAGARGITRVNNIDELKNIYKSIRTEFGPSTLQEFIPQHGFQYKCQMFRDKNGEIKATTIQKKYRYFPITGGSTSCSIIVEMPEIINSAKQVLDEIKWVGFADFDFIEDPRDNKYKIMEINPRIPASIQSSFKAGVNFAEMIVQEALNNDVPSYKAKTGIILRFFSLEVLWFLFSSNKDKFHSKPSWFKFFGKDICYSDGSFADPLPMLTGFAIGIKKYINPSFRKSKLNFNRKRGNE